jgi:hypothetical protein
MRRGYEIALGLGPEGDNFIRARNINWPFLLTLIYGREGFEIKWFNKSLSPGFFIQEYDSR